MHFQVQTEGKDQAREGYTTATVTTMHHQTAPFFQQEYEQEK